MADAPLLVLLHALGGSARSWDAVVAALDGFDCLAIDLPGFGDAANETGFDVAAMTDRVAAEVRRRRPASWMLVGHSMGGKIATILADRAVHAGELSGLAGVVLIAASPPAPEPMDENRRATMLRWIQDGAIGDADARAFVEQNIASDLPEDRHAQAIIDVRRTSPAAWRAWLEHGSREDWSNRIGRIALPTLIVAGAQDGDLGEANQRKLNLPHYPHADVLVVDDAAHLIPQEHPATVARAIHSHWKKIAGGGTGS